MRRIICTAVYILVDFSGILLSLISAFALKYNNAAAWFECGSNFEILGLFFCSTLLFNFLFACYDFIPSYFGMHDAARLAGSCLCSAVMTAAVFTALGSSVSASVIVIAAFAGFFIMCLSRISGRPASRFSGLGTALNKRSRRIVFSSLPQAKEILGCEKSSGGRRSGTYVVLSAPLDEKHLCVSGARIIGGGAECLKKSLLRYRPDEIVVTKEIAAGRQFNDILKSCSAAGCRLRLYTGIEDYGGPNEAIRAENLLKRKAAQLDDTSIREYVRGKTVLVTGGAGSIGRELCKQILRCGCGRLIIYDIWENGLFEINNELRGMFDAERFVPFLGSVRDEKRLEEAFAAYAPELVFHAAAHKHVPLMESNPSEAVKNNVIGTYLAATAAVRHRAEKFILISTDKAVNPASIMGASKRAAEKIVQALNSKSGETKLAAVRFGNVLGSQGSVVPFFLSQIRSGGPVTVTHPDVIRYFMSIPEAVQLVLQAGARAQGGEIFSLNMGTPVKILDLANDMIRNNGLVPGEDIKIEFVGLRPGEKMSEELSGSGESVVHTRDNSINICLPSEIDADFDVGIGELRKEIQNNEEIDFTAVLKNLIPEFKTE